MYNTDPSTQITNEGIKPINDNKLTNLDNGDTINFSRSFESYTSNSPRAALLLVQQVSIGSLKYNGEQDRKFLLDKEMLNK